MFFLIIIIFVPGRSQVVIIILNCLKYVSMFPQAPAGIHVWLPIYSIHRDATYWPEPNICEPERFSKERKANIVPYTYMPFGNGPRHCIGKVIGFLFISTYVYLVWLLLKLLFFYPLTEDFCQNDSSLPDVKHKQNPRVPVTTLTANANIATIPW